MGRHRREHPGAYRERGQEPLERHQPQARRTGAAERILFGASRVSPAESARGRRRRGGHRRPRGSHATHPDQRVGHHEDGCHVAGEAGRARGGRDEAVAQPVPSDASGSRDVLPVQARARGRRRQRQDSGVQPVVQPPRHSRGRQLRRQPRRHRPARGQTRGRGTGR